MKLADFEQMFSEGRFVHVNKTLTYLAPVLNHYGDDFRNMIRSMHSTGVYIDDLLCDLNGEYYLFMLVNVQKTLRKGIVKDFNQVLKQLRDHEATAYDYPFGELFSGKLHVIVFKVPEKYYPAYSRIMDYLNGRSKTVKYSRMYPPDDVEKLFIAIYGENITAVKVFRQDPDYRQQFENALNRIGIHAADREGNVDWLVLPEGAELEFLPQHKEELLNYGYEKDQA